jgi:hypothetical protein
MQLVAAAAQAKNSHGAGGNASTSTTVMMLSKFDRSTSRTVFHCKFEAVADHSD